MPKTRNLYIDQFGNRFFACSLRELRQQIPGRVSIMYRDKADGPPVRVGYVIGPHWLQCYRPMEEPAWRAAQ